MCMACCVSVDDPYWLEERVNNMFLNQDERWLKEVRLYSMHHEIASGVPWVGKDAHDVA